MFVTTFWLHQTKEQCVFITIRPTEAHNLTYINCLEVMVAWRYVVQCPTRKKVVEKLSWRITYTHDSHSLFLLFSSPYLIRQIPGQGTAAAYMAPSSNQSDSLIDSLCLPDGGADEGCRPTSRMEAVPLVGRRPQCPPAGREAWEGRRRSLASTKELKSGNTEISPLLSLPQQPAPREHLPRQNRRWGYFPTHAAASALVPLLAVEVASSTQRGPRPNDVVVLGAVSSSNQAKGPRLQKRPPVGTAWCHFFVRIQSMPINDS
jgi:hypothetical protein